VRLEAVNLGRRETVNLGARSVDTGIDKRPVERAFIGRLGLSGDIVADTVHHGGADQAVYLYSRQDYSWWEAELGTTLAPGTFGENLTVSDLGDEPRPGDRMRVGAALLELTAPRVPCAVFANKIGLLGVSQPGWVKRFAAAERTGAYARVLEEGEVAAGARIELLPGTGEHPSLVELLRLYYDKDPDIETVQRALRAPIAERERTSLETKLATLAR